MLNERLRQTLLRDLQPYLDLEQQKLVERIDFRFDGLTRLFNLNIIKEEILYALLSNIMGYPYRILGQEKISPFFNTNFYKKHRAVVLDNKDVIMADPWDLRTQDKISQVIEVRNIFLGSLSNIQKFIEQESIDDDILNTILKEAVAQHASDIHFDVEEHLVQIRFRLQGVLRKVNILTLGEWQKVLVRLKIKSSLDISETRRPQSGRLSLFDDVDLRISTHPTIYGENVVIRVLVKNQTVHNIENLGFEPFQIDMMRQMIKRNFGLILICGPTGSGKTTTLYSLLSEMQKGRKSIMTLEEPVEYKVPGIAQTEIIHDDIMSYAEGIKSMLRQDLDVMFIGEIRDEETAKMAFRAAFTGHLVLATLHTFDIKSTVYRLLDLGVTKEFMNIGLSGIIAQRLIRCVCDICEGKGCSRCYFEGLYKRQAIGEMVLWSKDLLDQESYDFVTLREIFNKKVEEKSTFKQELFEL
jgi:type II secretory ATPase GspE/PulE/Tfp pilus assembly ATPase PilB-like protein